ncbi:hypothetical protein [Glaciihabitans sp. UYNi722]|uniref:SCO7613 C-terminal domain-containing membrane protein n=1 Tax=Glaciihabitans sp. UYNi722 TaxID=3156344 RepID=UPI00339AE714
MAESETDFRQYAGRVVFPRTPNDLTSTAQCPACFAPWRGAVCTSCGLDLTHPAAAELAVLSADAAAVLDRRLDVIGRIRFETAQKADAARRHAEIPVAPSVPVSAPAASVSSVIAAPAVLPPAAVPPTVATPPQPAAPSTPTGPRRSSVQIILVIVGISLLSVAAIFFLVYAFINYGILVRSLIIAAVTIAAFVVASMLRRRSLTATAEGIAVFAVVLVYLDAFALRSNDFFGLGSADGMAYWGWTLVISAVVFVLWNRLSGLRTASIIGFAAFAPGIGLVVAGLDQPADVTSRGYFAFAAAALAGVVHRLAARPARESRPAVPAMAERIIVLVTAFVATLGAALFAFVVSPDSDWASTIALFGVAAVAAMHVVLVDTDGAEPRPRGFGGAFAGVAGASAALAVGSAVFRVGELNFGVLAPPIAAVVVALVLELAARRMPHPRLAGHLRVATWAAAAVLALALLAPALVSIAATVTAVGKGLVNAWSAAPTAEIIPTNSNYGFAILGLMTVGLLAAVAWTLGGAARTRGRILAWFGAAIVVLAVPLLSVLWAVLAVWLLLAVTALATLVVLRRRGGGSRRYSPPLVGLLAASATFAYLASWGSTSTWWIVMIVVIAILLAGRLLTSQTIGRAALLGGATVILLIGAAAFARQLALPTQPGFLVDNLNATRAAGIVAIVLLATAAVIGSRLVSVIDRRTLFWISGITAVVAGIVTRLELNNFSIGRVDTLLPEYGTSLAASAGLLIALVLWIGPSRNAALRLERVAASIALAPAVYWLVDSFVRVLDLPGFARSVSPITAALLAAVGALVVTVLRPGSTRGAREASIAIVAVPAVLSAIVLRQDATWLVLVIAAVTALMLSISADGLFSSTSPRRFVGWLALALAVAGLWWRLFQGRVQALEPFVLPVAGALLLTALLLWRANRSRANASPSQVAPFVALGGLLVAILPLALNATTGALPRTIIVGAVSAVLLIVGSVVTGGRGIRPYLDAAALAGGIGVIIVTIGRAISVSRESGAPDLRLDGWLAAAVIILVIAAFGQARPRDDASVALRTTASLVLGLFAMTAMLLLELYAFSPSSIGSMRALAVVLLFAALHVIALATDRAPFTRLVGWVAIAFAAIAAIGGLSTGALDRVELGSIPLAVALIGTGAMKLASTPTARTWPWLAPGVAVLLVPSLVATAWDAPLWRLLGLGIVSIAIIVISAALRLQAPFLIAVVVTIIHAIATFSPQIRAVYESVEWWLWLAFGGVIIVVLGARFEKNMRGFRSVAMRIKALR